MEVVAVAGVVNRLGVHKFSHVSHDDDDVANDDSERILPNEGRMDMGKEMNA